jgi:menaquinone-specific isochorismate synthase
MTHGSSHKGAVLSKLNVDALLDEAEQRLRCTEKDFVVVRRTIDPGLSHRLLAARISDFDSYWSPPPTGVGQARTRVCGFGAACSLRLLGEQRFADAQSAIQQVYSRMDLSAPDLDVVRFIGGAAFSSGRDGGGSCWQTFGDASFFLPQIFYLDDATRTEIFLVVERGRTAQARDLLLQVVRAVQLPSPPSNRHPSAEPIACVSSQTSADRAKWQELISGIKDRIKDRRAEKIVAARRVTVQLSRPPLITDVLERLSNLAPACTHFALRLGEKTFVGATPELLIEKRGRNIRSEALAGSIDARKPRAAAELLASTKDRNEHAFVARAIESALAPLCARLSHAEHPEVKALTSILHLATPIVGELRDDTHVLSLVQRLHPTPAVGGVPQRQAIEWISAHERAERGWYASPFGWVDARGDGRFLVALRSALLHKDKVHVYAGAGIVEGSEPGLEYAETELKLESMLGALGVAS